MTGEVPPELNSVHPKLVRYFHDCLAAQVDWARAINVIDQKDVMVVPLAAIEQQRFGADGVMRLRDEQAMELAKRVATGGADTSLFLGALFLVGRIAAQEDKAERRFCAPLLQVPLTLQQESQGQISIHPEEDEFSVNYSLVGELLDGNEDDLEDRLEDLAELVPDFPIDADEFDTFWNGFRMIAPELPILDELPSARKSEGFSRITDLGLASPTGLEHTHTDSSRLELVDFYLPQIPKEKFRLLPSTAIVLGRKAGHSMSALSELRSIENADLSKTAFGCVFDPPTARQWTSTPSDRLYPDEVQPLPLTAAQQEIVESSRSAPLTLVTGPPGTGKSYTITAIILDAILNGETVLLASQMDKAVEVVADQVEELAGPLAIARSGGRAAQRELAKKVAKLTGPLSGLGDETASTIDDCAKRHYDLTRLGQKLEERFRNVIAAERDWSQALLQFERLRPLCTLSVKEISNARSAKAAKLFSRTTRNLATDAGALRRLLGRWDLARIRRLLEVEADSEDQLEELGQLVRLQALRAEMQSIERNLKLPHPADTIWQELSGVDDQRHRTALELLRSTRKYRLKEIASDQQRRQQLRDLAKMLRRRKGELKEQLQQKVSAEVLLESFPAWACTSRSLCEILPATEALFDIVVIDEASQCDLALASVALMRAKRAVIVGDPHQLRRVCFLSRVREQAAIVRSELTTQMRERFNYRRSLFDVAADMVDPRHFFFLDEHFRSHPQIIEFSNQRFYDASLKIMTTRPAQKPRSVIRVHAVGGQREVDSSVNPMEVEFVLDAIRSITMADNSQVATSIGVVSPFRGQADAIRERLIREYSSEQLTRHEIVVGTAHSLQGDEKDVILFSLSIDPAAHPASLRFLESPNLFNVAITRARRELVVVTSVSLEQLPAGLLRDFLVYANRGWSPKQTSDQSDNSVEARLAKQLESENIDIWTGFRSAGDRINVVAMGSHDSVAIMCDGGSTEQSELWQALNNHRRLARAGWNVSRFSHRAVQNHWGACVDSVINRIKR